MKLITLFFLSVTIIYSCRNSIDKNVMKESDDINKIQLQETSSIDSIEFINTIDLINKNKDRFLFLSFWDGIDDRQLQLVKKVETSRGILKDGKFVVLVSNSNYEHNNSDMNININKIEEYPLSISNSYHSIILKYEDEYWIKSENENEPPLKDVSIKVAEYNFLIDYLIKLFDSKYKRIKSHSFANQYSWIKTNQNNFKILITLQPDFWYYGNNYYGTFDDIADDFKKHGSHSTQIIYDEKQSRYCLAYSNISIIYENYDMHQLLKKIEEDQKLKLIKNNSLKLKENGSNL